MLKAAHKAKNTEREKPVISAQQLPVGELTKQTQDERQFCSPKACSPVHSAGSEGHAQGLY